MVLFPAAKISFDFLLQAANNYFASLDRIKFKAAGCLSFFCLLLGVFSFHCFKLKMVVGLFVYQHLFSSRETKFLINLLRTHPRFRSATWPLLLPQVLRYPLGRDYSVTPPLSVERGNSELLPRHQQSSVKCLTILVQVEDYPERSLLYPRDFFSLSKAMEAYLTRQLKFSKSVWVVSSQPSLTSGSLNR